MHSLLIFDGLNDIVFMNNDEDFIEHIQHVLVLQGLQGQEVSRYMVSTLLFFSRLYWIVRKGI